MSTEELSKSFSRTWWFQPRSSRLPPVLTVRASSRIPPSPRRMMRTVNGRALRRLLERAAPATSSTAGSRGFASAVRTTGAITAPLARRAPRASRALAPPRAGSLLPAASSRPSRDPPDPPPPSSPSTTRTSPSVPRRTSRPSPSTRSRSPRSASSWSRPRGRRGHSHGPLREPRPAGRRRGRLRQGIVARGDRGGQGEIAPSWTRPRLCGSWAPCRAATTSRP